MAIPATPTAFFAQQGNGQCYVSWQIAVGATSYSVKRSTDGITYAEIATPTVANYTDTAVTIGQQYFYQVASVNASGTSAYTAPQSVVPSPSAELSLGEIRLRAQQRADRVDSDFVELPEWNFFINQAMYELYDLLITTYEDYFEAPEVSFNTVANQATYALPNGVLTFTDSTGATIVAPPFYKLSGVDLGLGASANNSNGFATVKKYNLIDRNKYFYPNTASTIYGVFNLRYRILGTNIKFMPTPSAGQPIRLLYIPRLPSLLADTDMSTLGFSGWLQYVIVRAAKYALDKEESSTEKLDAELLFLKQRIEETAANRDVGAPDTISDTRSSNGTGFDGGWGNGPGGGW